MLCLSLALSETVTCSILGHLVPVSNNQKKRIVTVQSGFQFGLEFVQSPLNFLAKGAETEVDKTPRCGTQIYYGNSAICKKKKQERCVRTLSRFKLPICT